MIVQRKFLPDYDGISVQFEIDCISQAVGNRITMFEKVRRTMVHPLRRCLTYSPTVEQDIYHAL